MNTFMQKLGVLAAMLSTFLSVFAYDFEADGIYYNITDPTAKEVEVTEGSYGEFYSGDIVVPPSVSYHGDLYSVASIGYGAFYDCSSLTAITSLAVTPPSCGASVFFSIDKQKCTLYVPAGSVEAYKQAYGWKDFVLVEAVEAGIDSVAAGTADDATEVFNLTGAKVADSLENLPAGIYLVREGSTVRKIAVR